MIGCLNVNENLELEPNHKDAFIGTLETSRGHLPLEAMTVRGEIVGLESRIHLVQTFVNAFDVALEATYIFPLPHRSGVTRFVMHVGDRVVEGELKERGQAREEYAQAIRDGHRAAITEQERPDVFTMRLGNIPGGERIRVELDMSGPLMTDHAAATFRFPLVVAPRYTPGKPLPGRSVGDGVAVDTDQAPDASRVSPPIRLRGLPHPVSFDLELEIDPAGLPIRSLESSLHGIEATRPQADADRTLLRLSPGVNSLDRDFILRLEFADQPLKTAVAVHQIEGDDVGTYALTVVPEGLEAAGVAPRDVVICLDRSGSMGGWKIAAARRAAARIIDALTDADRISVILFDNVVEPLEIDGSRPLCAATDRFRFRAVEGLARTEARGGTEIGSALSTSLSVLDRDHEEGREKVVVLITDGQVSNEDLIFSSLALRRNLARIHTVGIDRAVNASFLERLATASGGICELVESEDRLDKAMSDIHRRIGSPVLQNLLIHDPEETLFDRTPTGRLDVFPGTPLVVRGRFRGKPPTVLSVTAIRPDGTSWSVTVPCHTSSSPVLTTTWARGRILDLEHEYSTAATRDSSKAKEIVEFSIRHGVLSRFTAFVAVDRAEVVCTEGELHRITQPVETPDGWQSSSFDSLSRSVPAPTGNPRQQSGSFSKKLSMTYESLGSLSGGSGGIGDLGGLDCFRDLGGSPPAPSFSAPRPAPRPKMNNLMNECSDAPGPRRSQPLPPKTVEDIHRRELLQVIEALRSAIRGNDETLVRLTLTDLVNALRRAIHLASSWKLSVNILDTLESFLTQAKNLELGFTSAKVSQVDALMKALDLFGGIKPPPLEGKPREEFWK